MQLYDLCDDILYHITNIIDCKCHICHNKICIKKLFYKKQGKFYFCSKICYEFI